VRLMLAALLTEGPSSFKYIDHLCSGAVYIMETRDLRPPSLPCAALALSALCCF
jgi:hypothetical protein